MFQVFTYRSKRLGPDSTKRLTPSKIAIIIATLSLFGCESAPEEIDHFKYAMLSATRDFNLGTQDIPKQLKDLKNPYGYGADQSCEGMWREIQHLKYAIEVNDNRRVGYRRDNETIAGRFGNLRDEGVKTAATFFTPYRGAVQQVTGAAAFEKRALDANKRARIRLGYLIGQGRAYKCPGF